MEIQNIDQGNDFILEINRQNEKNENKRCKKLHLFACFFTLSKVRTDTERHHGARHQAQIHAHFSYIQTPTDVERRGENTPNFGIHLLLFRRRLVKFFQKN